MAVHIESKHLAEKIAIVKAKHVRPGLVVDTAIMIPLSLAAGAAAPAALVQVA